MKQLNPNLLNMKHLIHRAVLLGCMLLTIPTILFSQTDNTADFFNDLQFRNVGPTRGGRVTAVAGINSQAGTFYMGATGGGVWKTTDYGINWDNVSDGFFESPSIGAIRVFQKNPDIVYVGTGSDGIRSNVIVGKGVYKSTDAGKTWKHIGLKNAGLIGAVEINPNNPDIVFVAAIGQPFQPNDERGVFRTKDGGESWEKVLFIADTVGIADIEFAPDDPNIVYAAAWRTERKPWTIISGGENGGFYKSVDGGDHWTKIEKGLPTGIIGKMDLAVSKADPKRLYALVEAADGAGGVFRSDDHGESFVRINKDMNLLNRPFYYCNIDANPVNPDALFVNTGSYYHSDDAGISWSRRSVPHGDNHDIWINENDTNLYIQANDGGVNITTNDGKSWSSQFNQPTAELYQVDLDDQYPYWLYAGQQDNTTIAVPSLPPYEAPGGPSAYWITTGGCETGPAVPKPGNHNIVYANCKGHFGVYNKITGQERSYTANPSNIYGHNPKDLEFRFQRVAPIHVSPHNPDVVYHGSQYVHKTIDDGLNWEIISPDLTAFEPDKQVISGSPITRDITGEEYYSVIYSIRESPITEGLIWVGANDGPVHVTKDGGKNWENVTPPDLLPGGRVDCVEPSPHQAGKAYVAILRYQLGDWHPYIYKTLDYGQNWTLLTDGTNGLPADFPTRVVREDPDVEGLLFAGTEFGLFVSFNDGEDWQSLQQNLPVTPVTDIKVYRKDLVLSTMGRSFWIMDNISQLHHYKEMMAAKNNFLVKPEDTYRLNYRATRGNEIPSYPSAAVSIDYFIANQPKSEIKMEILDADKNIIQSFVSSDRKPMNREGVEDMAMSYYFQPSQDVDLKNTIGMHRVKWDMTHKGAWDKNARRSFRNGPNVAPGKYYVSLEIDGDKLLQEFTIHADPRLAVVGVGTKELKEQETLALKMVELTTEAKKLADKIDSRRKEIAETIKKKGASRKLTKEDAALKILDDQMLMHEGIYQQPQFIDQINYLSRAVSGADQKPSANMYQYYERLTSKLKELQTAFEER